MNNECVQLYEALQGHGLAALSAALAVLVGYAFGAVLVKALRR